jgi:hypothetical protein
MRILSHSPGLTDCNRGTLLGAVLLVVALPARAALIDAVIPAAASTPGANGSQWRTDVWMTNHGDTAATLNLFYTNNGLASLGTGSVTIPPHESLTLPDIVQATFHQPGTTGMILLRGTTNVEITSSTYNLQEDGGTAGSTIPALATNDLLLQGDQAGIPAASDATHYRDNIGFITTTVPVTMTSTLWSRDGSIRAQRSDHYEQFTSRQQALASFFNVTPRDGDFVEFLVNEGDGGMAYVSTNDNASNSPTIKLARPNRTLSKHAYLAGAGHTAGANGTQWQTDVVVHNMSNDLQGITFWYLPTGGANTLNAPLVLTVRPHETITFADIVLAQFTKQGVGALLYDTFLPFMHVTSRTYNTRTSGTYGVGITPEDQRDGAARFLTLSPDLLTVTSDVLVDRAVNGITQDAQTRTNVGVLNTSTEPAPITITYFASDGRLLGSVNDTLQPLENKQYGSPLRAFTSDDVTNAFAVLHVVQHPAGVVSSQGSQPVLLHAYPINNATGQNVNITGYPIATDAFAQYTTTVTIRVRDHGQTFEQTTTPPVTVIMKLVGFRLPEYAVGSHGYACGTDPSPIVNTIDKLIANYKQLALDEQQAFSGDRTAFLPFITNAANPNGSACDATDPDQQYVLFIGITVREADTAYQLTTDLFVVDTAGKPLVTTGTTSSERLIKLLMNTTTLSDALLGTYVQDNNNKQFQSLQDLINRLKANLASADYRALFGADVTTVVPYFTDTDGDGYCIDILPGGQDWQYDNGTAAPGNNAQGTTRIQWKLTRAQQTTGETYVARWLPQDHVWLSNKEARRLLAAFQHALATELDSMANSPGVPALELFLGHLIDGINSSSNEEFDPNADPLHIIKSTNTIEFYELNTTGTAVIVERVTLPAANMNRIYENIVTPGLAGIVSTNPSEYGGSAATGPALTHNPTWSTQDAN